MTYTFKAYSGLPICSWFKKKWKAPVSFKSAWAACSETASSRGLVGKFCNFLGRLFEASSLTLSAWIPQKVPTSCYNLKVRRASVLMMKALQSKVKCSVWNSNCKNQAILKSLFRWDGKEIFCSPKDTHLQNLFQSLWHPTVTHSIFHSVYHLNESFWGSRLKFEVACLKTSKYL